MPELELSARPRQVLGKKVKRLRASGILPGNVYGHNVDSVAVETPALELLRVARAAGRTSIIHLHVDGEPEPRTVLLRDLQRDPVTGKPLHVDFYQVSLTERMRVDVPVVLVGRSPAVDSLGGVLVQQIDTVTIEALPTDIPRHLEVDVSGLTELESSFHVRDLAVDSRIQIITEPDAVLARVSPPRLAVGAEEEAAAEAEAAAAAEAPAEAEAAEEEA